MFLTAQRVISPGGENGVNGFLYEHGDVAWETPPEPIAGSIGVLAHSFLSVTPTGDNKVVSYLDIVAPDGTSYPRVRELIVPWLAAQTAEKQVLPWTGVIEDVRFGLHMTAAYTRAWRAEVARLMLVCQMTLDRYEMPATEEPRP